MENKRQEPVIAYGLRAAQAVVSPSGNINNNNYDNNNGVRPFCITGSRSRRQAETSKDTKKARDLPEMGKYKGIF